MKNSLISYTIIFAVIKANDGDCYTSNKLTKENGDTFFAEALIREGYFHFWIYFMGSSEEAKKYSSKCSIKNTSGEKFTYTGPVHILDKCCEDVVASGSLLSIGIDALKRSLNEEKGLDARITIRNLKE